MNKYKYIDAPAPKKKFRLGIWDMLVILALILTICISAYFVLLFLFPQSSLNPLHPYNTVTSTWTPIKLEFTWTVTPLSDATEWPTLIPTLTFEPSPTLISLITPIDTSTSTLKPTTQTETPTFLPTKYETPNLTQTLHAAFSYIDSQFENSLKGNIAFNKPEYMKRDETASVELILSPSLSQLALATQLVDRGSFVTSTAEPNVLIAPNGETVTVETSQIEITPRMKSVLLPQDSEAFTVTEMHDNAEQVVSLTETTVWRWSVAAKKEGSQTLELIIYQLIKYDGKEFWREVETYRANIVVEVALGDRIKLLDWKWVAGFVLTLVGAIVGVLTYLNNRNKKATEETAAAIPNEEKFVEDRKKKKKRS